jgi:hypothetical protein
MLLPRFKAPSEIEGVFFLANQALQIANGDIRKRRVLDTEELENISPYLIYT